MAECKLIGGPSDGRVIESHMLCPRLKCPDPMMLADALEARLLTISTYRRGPLVEDEPVEVEYHWESQEQVALSAE